MLRIAPVFLLLAAMAPASRAADAERPNIVYLMSDELAYFELGHMGNPYLKTPRIDRFAEEGIRFTHAYAASPVCAPLRGQMMTGKHAGHASVRANDGGTPLRAEEKTIASLLKARGYACGGFGKWGAGGRDSTGVPEKHGFDVFYGYYDQVHAHSFYPPYLIRNSEQVVLPGNKGGRSGETYAQHAIMDEAVKFLKASKNKPFFLYLPFTPPHGMYDIPADDPAWRHYEGAKWLEDESLSQDTKNYAAMVSLIDDNLGTVLDLLKEHGLDDNTVVFFTGDNGGQDRFKSKKHPRGFYSPNKDPRTGVEFRAGKGSLYEGGLRIPYLVRWPGKIEAGQVDDLLITQYDVLATLCEIAGAETPDDTDGISFLPTLLGNKDAQKKHDFLYWEYGSQFAVRRGDWKIWQKGLEGKAELYKVTEDVSEENDVAADHPDIVAELQAILKREHEPARPGTFTTRERHERDRQAKWGSTRPGGGGAKVEQMKRGGLVAHGNYRIAGFSSENAGNGKRAKNAIDGDPTTVWHSQFDQGVIKHPHWIVIDLGAEYEVSGIRYLARQDNGWNGAFADLEIRIGPRPDTFPEAADGKATLKKQRKSQDARLAKPVRGRYVKITARSEVDGRAFASAAEIGVIGKE